VEFSDYLLLTDQGGQVFAETVCAYMKQNIGYEAAKAIYNKYEAVKDATQNYDGGDESLQSAQDALKQKPSGAAASMKGSADRSSASPGGGAAGSSVSRRESTIGKTVLKGDTADRGEKNLDSESEEAAENPLTAVAEAKKKGVLALTLRESAKVSTNSLTLSQTVSHRTLTKGTKTNAGQGDWYQTVLLNQYFKTYMSCYTDAEEDRALSYELEYLIGGKAVDQENLRLVVKELLAVREALNMASITGSAARQSEALSLATTLAGFTANPAVIEAVKYGIIAAWAFVESVLDLRTLLAGGSIALVKSDTDWTSNVNQMPTLLSGWSEAKSSAQGMSYRDYVGVLLQFHSANALAMRAMDAQEATVQREEGYTSFRMDHAVVETQLIATYEYDPLFMGFVNLLKSKPDMLRMQRTASYSYRSGKEGT
jgi:hypothetical protein